MLAYNATNYEEIALKRFEENIAVLNFYFDTPIITQIQLELRYANNNLNPISFDALALFIVGQTFLTRLPL